MIEGRELRNFVFVAASMLCGETILAWESDFVKRHSRSVYSSLKLSAISPN